VHKLVIASHNQGKVKEIQEILEGLPLEIIPIGLYPGFIMPEEDGKTFTANAVKKAQAVAGFTGEMSLADDSGLEVLALNREPGVLSARYAGEDCDPQANNRLLLEKMKDIPRHQREAQFRCVIALAIPSGKTYTVEDSCQGLITESPEGELGFGYDPLFFYIPASRTFAAMSAEEKNLVSHRGKAMRKIRKLLEELL